MKWFETVKYKIVPTKLLSHFSEVNCTREAKAAKEVTRGNANVISLSKYQVQNTYTEKEDMKFITNYMQREGIKAVDERN